MDDVEAPSETVLVAALRSGDQAAFERLVTRHQRELFAHCYRMLGSTQDAEDALQESLVSAWRRLPGSRAGAHCGRGCTGSRPTPA
jgi:DNA-directed RNA polymerase specialized sigma24 family protein